MVDQKKVIDRRKFLSLSLAGTLGLTAGKAQPVALNKPGKIAVQLYTVRREIEKDLSGTLDRIAGIGFRNVETAFWPDHISLAQANNALRSAGLRICAIHCEMPIEKDQGSMLRLAEVYECDKLIWHGWPEDPRYQTVEGIKQLADTYNQASEFAHSNGLKFGLHNHWWEFRNDVNGQYPYQILQPLLDDNIFFELDTYWIKVAGLDPAKIVKKFAKKALLLHIKDGPARFTESLGKDEPEPMTAIGKGTLDFPSIVAAAAGNTEWMVVEMDRTTGDVFKALEESYQYLINNKLALIE